ncbi:hypothetical protein AAVH_42048, partial [Aphelenchoides avenae]
GIQAQGEPRHRITLGTGYPRNGGKMLEKILKRLDARKAHKTSEKIYDKRLADEGVSICWQLDDCCRRVTCQATPQ